MAAGAALACKIRSDGRVSVAFFGDGATDEGHFHESLNMAALYSLPVVFVCENNFYSSHMHLLEHRRNDNIIAAAGGHGMPGVRADGNDVGVVFTTASSAVERARAGAGPTLLEYDTYRWRGHVGPAWDMDVGVKRKDELHQWVPKDPVARTARLLVEAGVAESELEALRKAVVDEVQAAVGYARESPYPDEGELLAHVLS
jgi:pyruvate dehydrogenase E1 component alpha subunit